MARESAPLDAELILRALADLDVDYVLIGGLAVQTHGHVRTTVDADIVPRPQRENLARLARALTRLEARPLNPGHENAPIDAAMLPRATIWQFDTVGGGLDVLHDVPGGTAYDDLRERALEVELGSITVPVAGLDDLIRMKLARGRPIDLEDVAALTDPNV
ncbi:MAG: hypothetical protein H0U25_13135 [Thermoleophilaceae bacterium]|nr:hypothetical protein [Thermoleophilaceae bacterium]